MKPRYTIEPVNEPDGEGNGWVPCDRQKATLFEIWDGASGPPGYDGMLVDTADSLEEAEAKITKMLEAAQ